MSDPAPVVGVRAVAGTSSTSSVLASATGEGANCQGATSLETTVTRTLGLEAVVGVLAAGAPGLCPTAAGVASGAWPKPGSLLEVAAELDPDSKIGVVGVGQSSSMASTVNCP